MLTTIILTVEDKSEVVTALSANPAFNSVMNAPEPTHASPPDSSQRSFEITDNVVVTDVAGRSYEVNPDQQHFLDQYKNVVVFLPVELQQSNDVLGELNWNLLRWLKSVARQTSSRVTVHYSLEAGDFPYADADWIFDGSPDGEYEERFSLGLDDPDSTAQGFYGALVRDRDGRVQQAKQ